MGGQRSSRCKPRYRFFDFGRNLSAIERRGDVWLLCVQEKQTGGSEQDPELWNARVESHADELTADPHRDIRAIRQGRPSQPGL